MASFRFKIFDRFGKGLREAPRDALIYLSSDKEDLNKSYNFHHAFDTIGAILDSTFWLSTFELFFEFKL